MTTPETSDRPLSRTEQVWRIRGIDGTTTECSIDHESDGTFTARMSRVPGLETVHVCRVGTFRKARKKAEEWRDTLLALGDFQDCSGEMCAEAPRWPR